MAEATETLDPLYMLRVMDPAIEQLKRFSYAVELNGCRYITMSKWKRGLSGFVNGRQISALADTGSLRNVVSRSFAQEMGLRMEPSPSKFMVGNTKIINSIGELVNPLTYPML